MPGKHVHFDDYSLSTPSPSWTVSSLPSSTGPITPPNAGYARQLPMSPMQATSVLPARPHPILSALHQTPLAYNLSYPPTTASITDPKLSLLAFSQAATEPALPYLEITHPRLPWKLVIQPTVSGSAVVTVADVLAGIHASLRTNVTAPEFHIAASDPMDPDRAARITNAYQNRCSRVPYGEARNRELKKGLKRIDFLEGLDTFEGLANTKFGSQVWCMKTTTPTPTR
ncbi:hypothetical protein NMY22_g17873 [Coprinellus aureogranulatus]|nr:hypothetical protein NMY22_g17873 [Coprinellus aureogranulatus]